LELFQQLTLDSAWLRALRPAGPAFSRRRLDTLAVVVRLMIVQRLLPNFSLSRAVQHLVHTEGTGFGSSKPISPRAGGYCRARQKLPTLVAEQVLEQIVHHLRAWLPRRPLLPERAVFVLDGSTLTLPHAPELVKAYPPHRNQRGASHWPLLRLVVLQGVQTGLALRPQWGPDTISEQALGLQALAHLPPEAVVIGDRNFGVFGIAWTADQGGHAVLLRLTRQRAERLAGGRLTAGSDQNITWQPSRWDQCGHHAPGAEIKGRLLCLPGTDAGQREPLYFFSTLPLPPQPLRDVYALRWNVETDLRSIKQTVHLQQLSARSSALLEKELLLAVAAYNLVRAVICLAAEKAQVPPRRLSFTNVYTLVETFSPDLTSARNRRQWDAVWRRIIDLATYYILPNRSKPRSYPRAVWPKTKHDFPAKQSSVP
jgi:putative transposase